MQRISWFLLFGLIFGSILVPAAPVSAEDPGYAGVDIRNLTKQEADKLGWEAPRGAWVVRTAEDGPAAEAGVLPDDIITTIDGVEVANIRAFTNTIASKQPRTQVRLKLIREGKEKSLTINLDARPAYLSSGPAEQQLMLDPGGHMAVVWGLTFTPDGRYLVTAGDDKVVRVWDWHTGQTVRIIRGQAGYGRDGAIGAIAISPDGKWLAVGGAFKAAGDTVTHIRIYDFATGELKALLKGHKAKVIALSFSPNSSLLISGSFDNTAIIWDVETAQMLHRLEGHDAEIYNVAFAPDGATAVTGSYDKTLRLWGVADGNQIAVLAGHESRIRALAINPKDGTIASASGDGEIRLWDGATGAFLRRLGKIVPSLRGMAFDPSGERLFVGCAGACKDGNGFFLDPASGKTLATLKGTYVAEVAMSPDGRVIATSGEVQDGILISDALAGVPLKGPNGKQLRLAGTGTPVWAVGFSTDGQMIAWGHASNYKSHNERGPLQSQLRLPSAKEGLGSPEPLPATDVSNFVRARESFGNLSLAYRPGGNYDSADAILDIRESTDAQQPAQLKTLNSIERVGATDGYSHFAYSFSPDGKVIVSGGANGTLLSYDLQGKRLKVFLGHEAEITAVAVSNDGRFLLSGSRDQTARLWNLKTGELLVSLFYGSDGEWVLWTPQGYYTGSPGADRMIGWQINKGVDKLPDYVGAEQVRQHLYRPDIVERAIVLASAAQAVHEAAGTAFKIADLLDRPIPRFRIVSPTAGSIAHGGRTQLRIVVTPTPDPIKEVNVQVNGRQISDMVPDNSTPGSQANGYSLEVPLSNGSNEIRVSAVNAIGEKTEVITLRHEGEGALDQRGTLYLLAVGVDNYAAAQGVLPELRFSSADASAFADAMVRRLGPLHDKVVSTLLTNGPNATALPTAANIRDALDKLRSARETDTVVVFLAGHGTNDGPNYRFLPMDAEPLGDGWRSNSAVAWYELEEALQSAKGRRLLFVDTCHAGNAYNQRIGNTSYHANIIAYSSARWDQEALERSDLGHGLFTYAVVEGIDGAADVANKHVIRTKELYEYVVKRVEDLAKQFRMSQEPQYFKGRDAEDYVLARW
jgi:WD40 repeat protein